MTGWLLDKSAYTRLGRGPDAEEWAGRIERGLVRIATATRLEIGFSARSGPDLRGESARPPLAHLPVVLHIDKDFELVAEVTGQATERLRTD